MTYSAYCVHQLFRCNIARVIGGGSHLDRLEQALLIVRGGEDHYRHLRSKMAHLPGYFQGISSSETRIDEHHVGVCCARQFENLLGIRRFTDNDTVTHLFEGRAYTLAEQGLLINDDYSYRFHSIPRSRAARAGYCRCTAYTSIDQYHPK